MKPFKFLFQSENCGDPFRFLAGGIGIERRFLRFAVPWSEHLSRCLQMQKRWSATLPQQIDTLLVLGAGRLFDFHLEAFESTIRTLHLVDGDRGCALQWRELQGFNTVPHLTEITGALTEWRAALSLESTEKEWNKALRAVREIPLLTPSCPPLTLLCERAEGAAVLSLNLLSQIPLGWQSVVEDHLSALFGATHLRQHSEEWLTAVSIGAKRLIELHLQQLHDFGAPTILLITDTEYLEYRGARGRAPSLREKSRKTRGGIIEQDFENEWHFGGGGPPVEALSFPALFGVDPLLHLPDYKVVRREEWMWDIAPGIHRGEAHRVCAMELTRSKELSTKQG